MTRWRNCAACGGSKAGIRQDELWKHGAELIRRAADSGNRKARYFVLEQEIEAAMPSRYPELMKEVESFCMLQYPPAFLLRAKLQEKQKILHNSYKRKTAGSVPAVFLLIFILL